MRAVTLRPWRPSPARAIRPLARTTFNEDNSRRKNNVKKLNSLFYEESPILSGDELSVLIYARFGRMYRPEIRIHNGRKFLVLTRQEAEAEIEMLHFNKIAEIINSESNPEHVKRTILHTENVISGSRDIEIPI